MKSVLISIQPKWVEKIASGEKTIEVRKTRPKLETPFKCYIYATKNGDRIVLKNDRVFEISKALTGKVIGEFVCDKITDISVLVRNCNEDYNQVYHNDECKGSCLTWKELQEYGNGKPLYGWHISELKIYDKPKELSEFKHWINDKDYDGWNEQRTKIVKGFVLRPLTRPFQSWGYIEV